MKPLLYALQEEFGSMRLHPVTHNIQNKAQILQRITRRYQLNFDHMAHIRLVQGVFGTEFGLCGLPLPHLLVPCWEDKLTGYLQAHHFPQLGREMLASLFFGMYHILHSTRLDVRTDVQQETDTHWYFHKTQNGYTCNRQYFYEGMLDYVHTGHRAELFSHYLSATSSSPAGGLSTIAYFDVACREGRCEIILPHTQFTYRDVLTVLTQSDYCQRWIQRKGDFPARPTLAAVRAGLYLLCLLWDCFSLPPTGAPGPSPFRENFVSRSQTYKNQSWRESEQAQTIFDSCYFSKVDFSHCHLEKDYIFCTFKDCNFANTQWEPEGVQHRFPILRCQFVNCQNLPKDFAFQYSLKGCEISYSPTL